METTKTAKKDINAINEKLKAMGFKAGKRLGMNILEQEVGDTVLITVTSPIDTFVSNKLDPKTKEPKTYEFVNVTNLETGETDMTFWLSGQIRYEFEKMANYVGKSFAITALGQTEVDGQKFNRFDIIELNN